MMRAMMKMASVSATSSFLLCCFIVASTDSRDACEKYGATGEDLVVNLHHRLEGTDSLKWKRGNAIIFHQKQNKIVYRQTGINADIQQNGSLKLRNLTKGDAGIYIPEVFNKNGILVNAQKSINLCVLDPVQKPKVDMECVESDPKVRFTCIVDKRDLQTQNLKIEWLQKNNVLAKAKDRTLTIVAKEVVKDSFACKVSNPASSATSEPVTQTCFEPPIFPEEIYGISIWVFVGGGGGIVLVLIVVVIVCCVRAKRKKGMRLKEEGELRLEWTNTEQQQQQQQQHQYHHPLDHHHHHHHHHQQQQQPAGHTGPRPNRPKQQRSQQRPRAPEAPNGHPQPSPRRPAQATRPVNNAGDEQPPPLPQPRKKAPRTQRV